MIQISALPAFTDNYIWLLQDRNPPLRRGRPGDAAPEGGSSKTLDGPSATSVTHHHHDHGAASNS